MHKEELITLHQVMAEIKDFFEAKNPNASFSEYYSLKVEPGQLHKSKMEHKHAIFVLGQEIAQAMTEVEYSASSRIAARMRELTQKTQKEIEYLH
ncbi:MAG: UPF0058 family protein [Methanomicrobiales archaeon]|nr:UPF0058 family protein [Methanomicrobiales archaeon]